MLIRQTDRIVVQAVDTSVRATEGAVVEAGDCKARLFVGGGEKTAFCLGGLEGLERVEFKGGWGREKKGLTFPSHEDIFMR